MRKAIGRLVANEDLNFLLTNRLPRRLATTFIGWFSKIEQPLVARASIAVWRFFSDVDLADAQDTHFKSMHACFTRTLRPGARPVDPNPLVLASPCDAIVGAHGRIEGDEVHQIKGAPYRLSELLGDADAARAFEGGTYVTLRLTAGMYHHFHAPHDLTVEQVTYISGDCWNVNPIALKRVERLFCKNERAAIRCRLADGTPIMLVAVAAVLVASIRLTFVDTQTALRIGGPRTIPLNAKLAKGADMGWFEHGSTIVMLVPRGFALMTAKENHLRLHAGEALFSRPLIGEKNPAGHRL
jgi:phosphatidylserine decarboxylase